MSRQDRRLLAFVERLLRDRRPRRYPADEDQARTMLAAAALRAGRPGVDAPHAEFVEKLERDLRRRMQVDEAPRRGRSISRRRLLGGAAAAVAAAAVGGGIDRAVEIERDSGSAPSGALVPEGRGRWLDVAAVEEVPVGRPLRFSAGSVEGFVVNDGSGFSAVSAVCSHMPCTLRLDASAQRLDCPCHNAWFALDGTPLRSSYMEGLAPLATVRTRIAGGRIEVYAV